MLTYNSYTSTVELPIFSNVKIEPSENNVLLLSDSDDDVCLVVDIFDTLSFFFRKTRTPISTSLFPIDVDNFPCNLPRTKLPPHGSPSLRLPLYISSFVLHLSIIDALKLTKSRRRSKSDLMTIDFDSIDLHDIKLLPPSFDCDVLFVLSSLFIGFSSAYGCSMDSIDKMCEGHHWCATKIINIQNYFGLSFKCSFCAGHL